jgi:hypothetical protein
LRLPALLDRNPGRMVGTSALRLTNMLTIFFELIER